MSDDEQRASLGLEFRQQHFVEVARDGRKNEAPAEDGVAVQKMLDGAPTDEVVEDEETPATSDVDADKDEEMDEEEAKAFHDMQSQLDLELKQLAELAAQ